MSKEEQVKNRFLLFKEKLSLFFKSVYKYFIFSVFFAAGYFSSNLQDHYISINDNSDKTPDEENTYEVINISDVSVAVDENKNLLLIERSTGEYKIYSDSVGLSIFSLYSNYIYNSYKKGNE